MCRQRDTAATQGAGFAFDGMDGTGNTVEQAGDVLRAAPEILKFVVDLLQRFSCPQNKGADFVWVAIEDFHQAACFIVDSLACAGQFLFQANLSGNIENADQQSEHLVAFAHLIEFKT